MLNSGNDDDDEDKDELRQMTRDDFDFMIGRIDRMEISVAQVISKVYPHIFLSILIYNQTLKFGLKFIFTIMNLRT